jgi:hypothetical protein
VPQQRQQQQQQQQLLEVLLAPASSWTMLLPLRGCAQAENLLWMQAEAVATTSSSSSSRWWKGPRALLAGSSMPQPVLRPMPSSAC